MDIAMILKQIINIPCNIGMKECWINDGISGNAPNPDSKYQTVLYATEDLFGCNSLKINTPLFRHSIIPRPMGRY